MKPPLRTNTYDFAKNIGDVVDSDDCYVLVDVKLDDEIRYIVAAVNACHAAGLTVEQLEAGELGRLTVSPIS